MCSDRNRGDERIPDEVVRNAVRAFGERTNANKWDHWRKQPRRAKREPTTKWTGAIHACR